MPVKPLYMDQASCDSIDTEEYAEPRVADEPLIASYMNFLIVNGGVIVPQYGDENDALAVQQIQAAFDEAWGEGAYKAVGVKTDQVVFGGGNIHVPQQEPAGKSCSGDLAGRIVGPAAISRRPGPDSPGRATRHSSAFSSGPHSRTTGHRQGQQPAGV